MRRDNGGRHDGADLAAQVAGAEERHPKFDFHVREKHAEAGL